MGVVQRNNYPVQTFSFLYKKRNERAEKPTQVGLNMLYGYFQ